MKVLVIPWPEGFAWPLKNLNYFVCDFTTQFFVILRHESSGVLRMVRGVYRECLRYAISNLEHWLSLLQFLYPRSDPLFLFVRKSCQRTPTPPPPSLPLPWSSSLRLVEPLTEKSLLVERDALELYCLRIEVETKLTASQVKMKKLL